ncbi:hypothetical protein FRB96_003432 [Tulasnella sp. 330]|nr:hypothetical protein FRB96_003432 [Tulasnella sp. 330]KAG8882760.1 hypothetical protein FRB97_007799 [Tulasnella sp. 331]
MDMNQGTNFAFGVLRIDELLKLVLLSAAKRPAQLLNIALTCHLLLEPALDELWYWIPDFTCLYAVWKAHGLEVVGHRRSPAPAFSRRVTSKDWKRFDYYASRIRRIKKHDNKSPYHPLTINLVRAIIAATNTREDPNSPLLPKLQTISFDLQHQGSLKFMEFLMWDCSTLESVTVSGAYRGTKFWQWALDNIRKLRCPLEHLDVGALWTIFEWNGVDLDLLQGVFDALEQHSEPLRRAALPWECLSHPVLHPRLHLLATLDSLTLMGEDHLGHSDAIHPAHLSIDGPKVLKGSSSGIIRFLLLDIHFRRLIAIHIEEDNPGLHWQNVKDGLRGVGTTCSGVESFTWVSPYGLEGYHTLDVAQTSTPIQSLSQCSALREMKLFFAPAKPARHQIDSAVAALNPTDGEWERAARSWPLLEELSYNVTFNLGDTTTPDRPPLHATLSTLTHFARHCRNLKRINVPFYATGLEEFGMDDIPFTKDLQHIDLCYSRINHSDLATVAVGDFLSRVTTGSNVQLTIPSMDKKGRSRRMMSEMCRTSPIKHESLQCVLWRDALAVFKTGRKTLGPSDSS